jgi:demethylspheroidene O-methyltransferase
MSDIPLEPTRIGTRSRFSFLGWQARLIASRKFQTWAAKSVFTRRLVRREGEALFDLLAGFCHSQILMALVKFDIPTRLMSGPKKVEWLAAQCDVPLERMTILLRAGAALGLLKSRNGKKYVLTRTGAALVGVPGLPQMIQHHDVLYRDLANPVAFFKGEVDTELAGFWPYVFGGDIDPTVADTYSDLMARSQILVAEDTLRTIDFSDIRNLMDVGGGSGAFLCAVGAAEKRPHLTLFDLPQVAPAAANRFAKAGLTKRSTIHSGSFREDAFPANIDAISLVRVLYDHDDESVRALLKKCHAALPKSGRLIISEPMSGGLQPERAGDAYFALYTLAMRTGKARSAQEIAALCKEAGFKTVRLPKANRPFVTTCLDVSVS